MTWVKSLGARLLRNPITGIAGCCARAARGHIAAAPLSRVMHDVSLLASPVLPTERYHTSVRQETAALRDFNALYVRPASGLVGPSAGLSCNCRAKPHGSRFIEPRHREDRRGKVRMS